MHDDRWRVSTAARRGWAAAGVGALRAAGQRGDAAHAHACPSAARARRASFKQLAGRESKPKSMRASRAAREGAGSEPVEISTSAGTPRTPTPFPVQRVHGERVTNSASPAAQQQMWPALITKKGSLRVEDARKLSAIDGQDERVRRALSVERAREERRRDEQRRAATRQRGESEAGAAKLDFCSSAGTSSTSCGGSELRRRRRD